jgi:hypothetical protein
MLHPWLEIDSRLHAHMEDEPLGQGDRIPQVSKVNSASCGSVEPGFFDTGPKLSFQQEPQTRRQKAQVRPYPVRVE